MTELETPSATLEVLQTIHCRRNPTRALVQLLEALAEDWAYEADSSPLVAHLQAATKRLALSGGPPLSPPMQSSGRSPWPCLSAAAEQVGQATAQDALVALLEALQVEGDIRHQVAAACAQGRLTPRRSPPVEAQLRAIACRLPRWWWPQNVWSIAHERP